MDLTIGAIGWTDIAVAEAGPLQEFYASVVGWEMEETPMGDYVDYTMKNSEGAVTGICHSRGSNSKFPPYWMIYVNVASVSTSISACESGGGTVIDGPKAMGESAYAILQDPQGAPFGIIGPP